VLFHNSELPIIEDSFYSKEKETPEALRKANAGQTIFKEMITTGAG